MAFDLEEFRSYLQIDRNALDTAVMRQPVLLDAVSEAYVEAAAERDALKEELATIDARLDLNIRAGSTSANKVTEPFIKAKIQVDPKHQQAFAVWLEAKEYADKLGALKDAFRDRSYMLRELGNLYVSNYFQQTSVKPTQATDDMVFARRRERLKLAKEGDDNGR